MKTHIVIAVAIVLVTDLSFAQPFAVSSSSNTQQSPAVSNGIIVWQEYVNYNSQWDWDIYGVDVVNNLSQLLFIAAMEADQTNPSIWKTWVAWEDNYYTDLDVWVSNITDLGNITTDPVALYENDQSYPKVHGNMVVWQHQFIDPDTQAEDWDIYAADITEPNNTGLYAIASFLANQQRPDIYRNFITWQDDYYGDNDIMGADTWLRNAPVEYTVSSLASEQNYPAADGKYIVWQETIAAGNIDVYGADVSDPQNPVEFLITNAAGQQTNPAISGHLVVWQDNRSGNWDIWGYNLVTRQSFQITNDTWNQTAPVIDGLLAAYEDNRSGQKQIYAVWLEGANTASCPTPPAGDANGDCQVNMTDLMNVAANWLINKLTY